MTRRPFDVDELEPTEPECSSCGRHHRPDIRCWTGLYRERLIVHVLATQGRVCSLKLARCTGVATSADHVIPRSMGGDDSDDNLRPACLSCNAAKGNRRRLPPEPTYRTAGVGLSPRFRGL
jgi:5-methylcytosine-specific restriction endonuclease McrA